MVTVKFDIVHYQENDEVLQKVVAHDKAMTDMVDLHTQMKAVELERDQFAEQVGQVRSRSCFSSDNNRKVLKPYHTNNICCFQIRVQICAFNRFRYVCLKYAKISSTLVYMVHWIGLVYCFCLSIIVYWLIIGFLLQLTKELENFGPEFFDEIEELKFQYREAVQRNVHYEEQLSQLSKQFGVAVNIPGL